jgi:hypothetical protein
LLPTCALLAALLCTTGAALADDVVLFRCTDADGALTVQNAPCPAGSLQRIERFVAPASSTPPTSVGNAAPAAIAPVAGPPATADMLQHAPLPVLQGNVQTSVEAEGSEILDSDVVRRQARQEAAAAQDAAAVAKAPLPEIYQCQGSDGNRYLHEREPAPPHCVLMTVTGLGGNTPVNAAGCEVIRDQCEAIAQAQRCNSWQQRFRDARGSERFAAPENKARASAERERLQAILADSDCAVP